MEPWCEVVTPCREVREGRSFNPDDFAIHLERVVNKTAPEDYRDPRQFFSRTCWTSALRTDAGMVLRRLAGKTQNTAPVLTLVGKLIPSVQENFGKSHLHSGAGIRDLSPKGSRLRVYECRIGTGLRLIFTSEPGSLLYFHTIGNHDQVRRFLKSFLR